MKADSALLPQLCRLSEIRQENPTVKTLRLQTMAQDKPFSARPGQLGMLSLLGVGEAVFAVSAEGENWLEFTVKRAGLLTEALHQLVGGETVGLRGPYGNYFPLEEAQGRDLLFIGGGLGLAPLRYAIRSVCEKHAAFGRIDLVYGARNPGELLFSRELDAWAQQKNTALHLTVDEDEPGWAGQVGQVAECLKRCAFSPQNRLALLCGPPAMLQACLHVLAKLGFSDQQIVVTLERRMQCGVGQCGRCNIGGAYLCREGPVFTKAQLNSLPGEVF